MTRQGRAYGLRGTAVTVFEGVDGSVTLLHDGRELPAPLLVERTAAASVADDKSATLEVTRVKTEQGARPRFKPPTIRGGAGSRGAYAP